MKPVTIIIWMNLLAILVLVLVYPHLMISPGKLLEGHQDLTTDCFACHTPFLRSAPEHCITCHKADEIGKLTTKGKRIPKKAERVPFHQQLIERDCVACHSDHQGVQVYRKIHRFSHELLMEKTREQCKRCHDNPDDRIHRRMTINCNACHSGDAWKPALFEHDRYFRIVGATKCTACHHKPVDRLHVKLRGSCDVCHVTDKWKPAKFDHDDYFRFDRDHDTECETCHVDHDYRRYTCYGCHEHSPGNVRGEHVEEGIRDFEDCVECHRSADEDEAERIWRQKRGLRGRHDDD